MKTWRVRSVEETDSKVFAAKLQSALNAMERLGLGITVDRNTVAEGMTSGRFLAVVTGHGEAPEKKVPAVTADAPAAT